MRTILLAFMLIAFNGLIVSADELGAAKGASAPSVAERNLTSDFNLTAEDASQDSNFDLYDLKLTPYVGDSLILTGDNAAWVDAFGKSAKSTVIWGGFLPFVAIPDGREDPADPGLFSEGSISFFWYLKTRF